MLSHDFVLIVQQNRAVFSFLNAKVAYFVSQYSLKDLRKRAKTFISFYFVKNSDMIFYYFFVIHKYIYLYIFKTNSNNVKAEWHKFVQII